MAERSLLAFGQNSVWCRAGSGPCPVEGRARGNKEALAVIRILVVDDQTLVCSAFRDMLGKQKDFLVVSAVGTAQEALDWVRRDPP
jgi:PleD family two-component response regulator